MTPTHTRKGGRLYRYYIATDRAEARRAGMHGAARAGGRDRRRGDRPGPRPAALPGDHRAHLARRQAARSTASTKSEVREALQRLDPLWDELFPAEQARIVQLLVERVDVSPDGVDIRLRTEGLTNLTAELDAVRPEQEGSVMAKPKIKSDGRTITVRVPISIRKRGGRKLVLAPDGTVGRSAQSCSVSGSTTPW